MSGLQSRNPSQRAAEEVTRLQKAGDFAMQSKDFNLALKFYEAAVNWQPGRQELWEGLANAASNLGAPKEVGLLVPWEEHNKSYPVFQSSWFKEKAARISMKKSSFQESQEQNKNEKTFRQTDALSSKNEEEEDKSEDLLSEGGDTKKEEDPAESDSEEEMLKRAIAMSLEDP